MTTHLPSRLTARLALAVSFAGILTAACGEPATTGPGTQVTGGALTSITVSPNVTLSMRTSRQFVAVGKDAAGVVIAISPTWSVTGGGTISAGGLFTADTTSGTFTSTVKAASGAVSGTASVVVTNGAVASMSNVNVK